MEILETVQDLSLRTSIVETRIDHIQADIADIKSDIRSLSSDVNMRFDAINARLDDQSKRFEAQTSLINSLVLRVEERFNSQTRWLAGVIISVAAMAITVLIAIR